MHTKYLACAAPLYPPCCAARMQFNWVVGGQVSSAPTTQARTGVVIAMVGTMRSGSPSEGLLLPQFHMLSRVLGEDWDARIGRASRRAKKAPRIVRLPCPLRLAHGFSLCSPSPEPASGIPSHLAQSKSIPLICHGTRCCRQRLSPTPDGCCWVQKDRMHGGYTTNPPGQHTD